MTRAEFIAFEAWAWAALERLDESAAQLRARAEALRADLERLCGRRASA